MDMALENMNYLFMEHIEQFKGGGGGGGGGGGRGGGRSSKRKNPLSPYFYIFIIFIVLYSITILFFNLMMQSRPSRSSK